MHTHSEKGRESACCYLFIQLFKLFVLGFVLSLVSMLNMASVYSVLVPLFDLLRESAFPPAKFSVFPLGRIICSLRLTLHYNDVCACVYRTILYCHILCVHVSPAEHVCVWLWAHLLICIQVHCVHAVYM